VYIPSVPAGYRYFTNISLGGIDFMNFCPVYTGYGNRFCADSDIDLSYNPFQEVYGQGSFCFESVGDSGSNGGCYAVNCSAASPYTYTITMSTGAVIDCGSGNTNINVNIPAISSNPLTMYCPASSFVCGFPSLLTDLLPVPIPPPNYGSDNGVSTLHSPVIAYLGLLFVLSVLHEMM